ncbi:MAG: PAS domain S-box protein [Desulfobacterales bacterium]
MVRSNGLSSHGFTLNTEMNEQKYTLNSFFDHKIAIVGAGNFCACFLEYFFCKKNHGKRPLILGVADKDKQAKGFQLADKLGLYTTTDYRDFRRLEGLQIVLEMSNDPTLADEIIQCMPESVHVIDHYESRTLWDLLMVKDLKDKGLERLEAENWDPDEIGKLLETLVKRFALILGERNDRSRHTERDLWEQEEAVSQIIQGSTIPTFVIDRNHQIIHWNKALERLTNVSAAEVVGTDKQWVPFYKSQRPTMADVILDQIDTREIGKLYGAGWNKSALIEGAYQAESFFQNLGKNGKWLFFTAAPIKARNGKIIGAIETFWDKTEDKRAEQEQERYTHELTTLVEIYTALNEPVDFEKRLDDAFKVVLDFMDANAVCIFLLEEDGSFCLRYSSGKCDLPCPTEEQAEMNNIITRVAVTDKLTIFEESPTMHSDWLCPFHDDYVKALIYVPISNKEQNPFGVIRIISRKTVEFAHKEKDILELIGNRIGVAIENAMLQEQYIKSEEKYRTLFNNDPTPIFLIDRDTYQIIDMNQRAKDTYGYKIEELYGTTFLELGDPDDDEVISGLENISKTHSVLFSKRRHYKKGGQPFFVTIVVSAAEYGGKNILIANTTDITEIVEKETQLIQASKMTTLGVMAAGMAHEINQPLNVIQICADFFLKMLKKEKPIPDEDLKSMARDIVENVDRASKVIKHVRDFARQTEVVRNKLNVNVPIRDIFKVLGHQLKVHQIELILDLDENLPPIMADHNRIEQVFINLVTNAIDAMDEKAAKQGDKGVEKVLTIKSFSENGYVSVTVSDTGIGMSDDVLDKLFEPFFTTKKTGKGTGLGVSISYGIIKDYEGKIEVNSKVGIGTTFKVKFPAGDVTAKEAHHV